MYYSSIGVLAILILFINNFSILIRTSSKKLDAAHRAYKRFLLSIAAFYLADVLWSLIDASYDGVVPSSIPL